MQKRLIASVTCGLLGAVVASTMDINLGLTPTVAMAGCSVAGLIVGYVGSTLFDVFTAPSGDQADS